MLPAPCPRSGSCLWGWRRPDPGLTWAHPCMVGARRGGRQAGLGRGSGAYSPQSLSRPQASLGCCEATLPTAAARARGGASGRVRPTRVLRKALCPQWAPASPKSSFSGIWSFDLSQPRRPSRCEDVLGQAGRRGNEGLGSLRQGVRDHREATQDDTQAPMGPALPGPPPATLEAFLDFPCWSGSAPRGSSLMPLIILTRWTVILGLFELSTSPLSSW